MHKFVVPASSCLQKAIDLDRKFVLMRDGVLALSMILPPEREPGSREWLLVPMEGATRGALVWWA